MYSVLLYSLYCRDMPSSDEVMVAQFADDTGILAAGDTPGDAQHSIQQYLTKTEEWCSLWKVKINPTKSSLATFTLRRDSVPAVRLNGSLIPQVSAVKYLGVVLDRRLTWKPHVTRVVQEVKRRMHHCGWRHCGE